MTTATTDTTVYQIPGWDHHFENNKSRDIDECSYVAMPNKQHGMGFTRIMAQPDGAAIFGVWCLILQAASRQERPRNGWLTDDGTETGIAWDIEDLAMRWRRPVEEIRRALDVLCSPKIGWLKASQRPASDCRHGAGEVPPDCRPTAGALPSNHPRTNEQLEEKEQPEQPTTDVHPGDHPQGSPAPPAEPPTGTDADLWRYRIGAEPWTRALKRAGCKIGPNNWRAWQGLIERAFAGNAEACATAAAQVKPDDRWPDKVEAAARASPPSPTASKYAGRHTRTVQVTP